MPNLNPQNGSNYQSARLRSSLASTLCLALVLSTACKTPTAPATPVSAAAVPNNNNQSTERTPDEIALIDAAIKGDTAAARALLDRGVNANTKDPDGRTPLTEAAYYGHTEIAKLLLDHGADIFAKKTHGETVYEMAAGHQDIAEMIKREVDLLDACIRGDVKLVKELLDKGAHANVRDPDGRTPLTEAVWNRNVELVKLLLDRGANVNIRKNDGATPLSIATGKGYIEMARLLKKAGAK
jgi:ankyrin repeat protein